MAAARTQKRASANAKKSPPRRGASASASSRTRRTATPPSRTAAAKSKSRSTARRSTARRAPGPATSRGRRPKRQGVDPRIATAAIVASLLFAAWTIYPVLRLQYQQDRERQTLAAELAGLQERNSGLREQVEALKTPEGIEQAARESLGLVKPGEQAYVVTGGTSDETSVTAYDGVSAESSFLQRALDAVFGFN